MSESWDVGCWTCGWWASTDDDLGPIDRATAEALAAEHQCGPDVWLGPLDGEHSRTRRRVTTIEPVGGVL